MQANRVYSEAYQLCSLRQEVRLPLHTVLTILLTVLPVLQRTESAVYTALLMNTTIPIMQISPTMLQTITKKMHRGSETTTPVILMRRIMQSLITPSLYSRVTIIMRPSANKAEVIRVKYPKKLQHGTMPVILILRNLITTAMKTQMQIRLIIGRITILQTVI